MVTDPARIHPLTQLYYTYMITDYTRFRSLEIREQTEVLRKELLTLRMQVNHQHDQITEIINEGHKESRFQLAITILNAVFLLSVIILIFIKL